MSCSTARDTAFRWMATFVHLTARETAVLHVLMARIGQVVYYSALAAAAWGIARVDPGALDRLVNRLRRRIEPSPHRPTGCAASAMPAVSSARHPNHMPAHPNRHDDGPTSPGVSRNRSDWRRFPLTQHL